jgi:putative methylase
VKKKDLEIVLQGLAPHPSPSPRLEQYATPAGIAAEVLFLAAQLGDIQGRKVVDLGCGTGVLGIGAALIGAREVVGIDVDEAALGVARANASRLGVDLGLLTMEVGEFPEACDTVLMNPPFGAQQPHADLPFLDAAFRIARVLYSFHNAPSEAFVLGWIQDRGGRVTHRLPYAFPILRQFAFHSEDSRVFPVVLLRTLVPPLRGATET